MNLTYEIDSLPDSNDCKLVINRGESKWIHPRPMSSREVNLLIEQLETLDQIHDFLCKKHLDFLVLKGKAIAGSSRLTQAYTETYGYDLPALLARLDRARSSLLAPNIVEAVTGKDIMEWKPQQDEAETKIAQLALFKSVETLSWFTRVKLRLLRAWNLLRTL